EPHFILVKPFRLGQNFRASVPPASQPASNQPKHALPAVRCSMTDLFNNFARPDWPGAPDGRTLLFMLLLAFTTGLLIGFVYMWTHEALSYSRTFVGALAVMPVIVSM